MAKWLRFVHNNVEKFGTLENDLIDVHVGSMFDKPSASGEKLSLAEVMISTPTVPTTFIALWNNYHALAAKLNSAIPAEPLYLIKASSSILAHGETIQAPKHYQGKVVFEGELGIVIGSETYDVGEADAVRAIFGYTCINDVTAGEIITRDATFAQWTRAKSFPTFGVFGPLIATDIDPAVLRVRTLLDGVERQNYPCADMIFSPREIVSLISRDVRLLPGDVIACGTSVGVGSMKPGATVEVVIDGIGTLRNTFHAAAHDKSS
jgi:2-keto-4-pentenoate hydratase/2-oxohepta-3-ene-1,7-dioic acid hydratase in catechol pathway